MSADEPARPEPRKRFSVSTWLAQSKHDYLFDGRSDGGLGPSLLQQSELLRSEAVRTTIQMLVVERCGLAASAGLINAAEAQEAKTYLATQVLDAARHVEALSERLESLGIEFEQLDASIAEQANPDLLDLAETALTPVTNGDFIVGLIGQNLVLTEITLAAYELLETVNRCIDPDFSETLVSMIADDRRHLEFGSQALEELVANHPEKKSAIVHLATRLSRHMIHAFADLFRDNPTADELRRLRDQGDLDLSIQWQDIELLDAAPNEVESKIIALIARRLKQRLARLGMGYRRPTPLEMR